MALKGLSVALLVVSVHIRTQPNTGSWGGPCHKPDALFGGSGNPRVRWGGEKGRRQADIGLGEDHAM